MKCSHEIFIFHEGFQELIEKKSDQLVFRFDSVDRKNEAQAVLPEIIR